MGFTVGFQVSKLASEIEDKRVSRLKEAAKMVRDVKACPSKDELVLRPGLNMEGRRDSCCCSERCIIQQFAWPQVTERSLVGNHNATDDAGCRKDTPHTLR